MIDIITKGKKILRNHYKKQFQGLIIYGSMARSEANPESDIDLLVLLNKPCDYFRELREITNLLYPRQLESERLISAKPAAADEFETGSIQL